MARASTPTLLGLDRYAQIMGITPAHFNGAYAASLNPVVFPLRDSCAGVWFQYPWQSHGDISREEVARAIGEAEEELALALGYWPAPVWIAKEVREYPRPFRRNAFGDSLTLRGQHKSIKARWGKIIAGGRRAVSLVGTATTAGGELVYSDPDGDSLSELATITLATTLTDECEIKVYFAGHAGDPEWEVRPLKSRRISGGNVVITLNSWLLIDPELWETFPTDDDEPSAIDISTTANFATSTDVYHEYTDSGQAGAEFFWEPWPYTALPIDLCTVCSGAGCAQCQYTTQTGCLYVRDVELGLVVPQPATWDADDEQWNGAGWTECREPDQVKLWYYAGEVSARFLTECSCEMLSDFWAQTIAWLATARLKRPFCACGTSAALAEELQQDLAFIGESSHLLADDAISNPFGTHRGEVMAWRRVSRLADRLTLGGGAI